MNYEPEYKPQIKKYVMDENQSWEERFRALEEHHKLECKVLHGEIERLRKIINDRVTSDIDKSSRQGYPWD